MADMTPLADILNGDDADATPVQSNFQTIEAYINGTELVRTDGTEVMTADLDLDGNTLANISGLDMNTTKITNLADGTASGDAVNYGQLTQDDSPLPLGVVAYAAKTSDQTGFVAGVVDVSGLSATWTAVTGRLYKTSIYVLVNNNGSGTSFGQSYMVTTDDSNNQKQTAPYFMNDSSSNRTIHFSSFVLETGLSGSVTRKVRYYRLSGATGFTVEASATSPAYILVEDLGLA